MSEMEQDKKNLSGVIGIDVGDDVHAAALLLVALYWYVSLYVSLYALVGLFSCISTSRYML